MFGIGMTELLVVFVVGLVVLGPKRLPSLARSLGRTLAEFRHASNDLRRDFMDVANSVDSNEIRSSDVTDPAKESGASEDPQERTPAAKGRGRDEGPESTGE